MLRRFGSDIMRTFPSISKALAVIACVATLACGAPATPDPDAAAVVGDAVPLPQMLPPPSQNTPRYVGLWATSAEGCANPAWRFEEREITTQGEVSCAFETVTLSDRGYDISAQCTAEAPPAPYELQLSFAESARAMMVAGGPWQPSVSLVYCSPLQPNE